MGDGTTEGRLLPVQVTGLTDVKSVIGGGTGYSLALKKDGTVWVWGNNESGQLGTGISLDTSFPGPIAQFEDEIEFETGCTLVIDNYFRNGEKWIDVNIKGLWYTYELDNDNFPTNGSLYEYSLANNKITYKEMLFNPITFKEGAVLSTEEGNTGSVTEKVYVRVNDVDTSNNAIKINGTWYFTNYDTIIYDYSDWYGVGDDAEFLTGLDKIAEGDYVISLANQGDESKLEMLIIVNNVDKINQ